MFAEMLIKSCDPVLLDKVGSKDGWMLITVVKASISINLADVWQSFFWHEVCQTSPDRKKQPFPAISHLL